MKKLNILKKLLGLAIPVLACTLLTMTPASADMVSNAGLIPAGFGYTHGRIPVVKSSGRPEIHDANIMRYDRNSRIKDTNDASNQNNNQDNTYQNRQQF